MACQKESLDIPSTSHARGVLSGGTAVEDNPCDAILSGTRQFVTGNDLVGAFPPVRAAVDECLSGGTGVGGGMGTATHNVV